MNIVLYTIEIYQPIGTFYIGKMKSGELLKIATINRRQSKHGIQRALSGRRVKDIVSYCSDPDATFPTPIILAMQTSDLIQISNISINGIVEIIYNDDRQFAEILDGQHRVEGIRAAQIEDMDLPVVIMFDLTEEEKAYVFSTINSNQNKVDRSLIYDLFDLSTKRSPYKSCHEIARIMNSNEDSPFYRKLKMLGKKTEKTESLSQGTFVSYLVKLISVNPQQDMIIYKNGKIPEDDKQLILRKYFIGNRDDIILKLLNDYFIAVKEVFPQEWDDNKYILSKTTGYGGLLKVFKELYLLGMNDRTIDKEFFIQHLEIGKENLQKINFKLTSQYFPSNEQTQSLLAKLLLESN